MVEDGDSSSNLDVACSQLFVTAHLFDRPQLLLLLPPSLTPFLSSSGCRKKVAKKRWSKCGVCDRVMVGETGRKSGNKSAQLAEDIALNSVPSREQGKGCRRPDERPCWVL